MKLILKSILIAFVLLLNSCKKEEKLQAKNEIKNVYSKEVTLENLCDTSWFPHNQTPEPKEGKGSPFDVSNTTNAIFHQWSWQKFLWLTKPVFKGKKLFIKEGKKEIPLYVGKVLPLFLDSEKIHQVTSHMKMVSQKEGTALVLTDTLQAGSSGVLRTNPKYNKENISATVFYSIHVDSIMKTAAEKFKDSIINGKLEKNNLSAFPVGSLELKV